MNTVTISVGSLVNTQRRASAALRGEKHGARGGSAIGLPRLRSAAAVARVDRMELARQATSTRRLPDRRFYAGIWLAPVRNGPGARQPASAETIAFQLTMPGMEEETFYRGVLLLSLDQAFRGRVTVLGVDWGWGAVLSCALFGLAHAFGFSDGHFSFDPLTMALTALPSFLGIWLRLRTGSCSLS